MMEEIEEYLDCKNEPDQDLWRIYCNRFENLSRDWHRRKRDRVGNEQNRSEIPFRCFEFDPNIVAAVRERHASSLPDMNTLDSCVTVDDYQRSMRTLTQIREVYLAIELRRFDQFGKELTFKYDQNDEVEWCGIDMSGLASRRPSDYVILRNLSKSWMEVLKIEKMVNGHITLPLGRAKYFTIEPLNIYFVSSGVEHETHYLAINEFAHNTRMQMITIKYISSPSRLSQDKIDLTSTDTRELRARLDKLDERQRQAVLSILQARCWPRAYIINGPPGTGKSHTIVEAVVQIFERWKMSVLVCTDPAYVNCLSRRLRSYLPDSAIVCSKWGRICPDRERIIVVRAYSELRSFYDSRRFDYVFIYQAGIKIPETLVPMCLLKQYGCLVLAGDFNLLNYAIEPARLLEQGLDRSILEHVLDLEVYKRDSTNDDWNSDYVTFLNRCHRSDKRIMLTLNNLFRHGQIEYCNSTPKSLLSVMQLTGPVQFLPSFGHEGALEDEADTCVNIILRLYKIGLTPEQVGVISPFKCQVDSVRSKLTAALRTQKPLLNQRYPERSDWSCKIGTIGKYQGYEREILIVSAVVSSNCTEGDQFHPLINDPKRFNLTVSRAKWLLIVVGHLDALNRGEYMPELIANGRTDEIGRWPVHSESESPFEQVSSLFRAENYFDSNSEFKDDDKPTVEAEETEEDHWLEYCNCFIKLREDWQKTNPHWPGYPLGRFRQRLRCMDIDDSIVSAVVNGSTSSLSGIKVLALCKTVNDYKSSMTTLLEYKEIYEAIKKRRFDQFGKKLTFKYDPDGALEWYGIEVPGLAGRKPADFLVLQSQSRSWMEALQIEIVMGSHIILPNDRAIYFTEPLNFYFVQSGSHYEACYRSIDEFSRNERMQMIAIEDFRPTWQMPRWPRDILRCFLASTDTSELRARLDKLDECQRKAVLGILRARCSPRAYIVYGLPGTGKSHTIVEAVVQIFKRSEMNVLVCTGSNVCADHLYEKLGPHVPRPCLLRLRARDKVNDVYYGHRIVVATNIKSNALSYLASFDYVFIDEANHVDFHESLVPMCRLKKDGCLVLAGDFNLLNYVADSGRPLEKDLDRSILEHVLDFEVYKRDSESGEWNSDYITFLSRCHRSDRRIMSTLNKLFYDGQIECCNSTPKSILNLMRLTGPVQFLPVFGQEEALEDGRSVQNEEEANACVDIIIRLYKIGLEPGQVGVISPFKLQVDLIRSKLEAALAAHAPLLNQRYPERSDWGCKIGTIDSYEGAEREVVIVSTVASSRYTESSQFHLLVSDLNRFNVTVSRAKWLLIVVGHLDALNRGEYLPELIANGRTDEIRVGEPV